MDLWGENFTSALACRIFGLTLEMPLARRPGRDKISPGFETSLNTSIGVQENFHFFPKP